MLQLANTSPFAATMAVFPDRNGIESLFVIVRATLSLTPHIALAPVQLPPAAADEYYGDPETTSLRQASEMHIGKPGTDVLLVGSAWAREGRPTASTLVTLAVGDRRKSIRVVGDRVWRDGRPTHPQPFESLPLVWERAFGGSHERAGKITFEERNPVGVGFGKPDDARDWEAQPLPNLEDPKESSLEEPGQAMTPVCFAPIAASWQPRRGHAGTYDERWQRTRAPYLPEDFDPRHLQCSPAELAFDRHLRGGEPIEIQNASPQGLLRFRVPNGGIDVVIDVAGAEERPEAKLETVLIEPDANRLSLIWRASLACDRRILKVRTVRVAPAAPRKSAGG